MIPHFNIGEKVIVSGEVDMSIVLSWASFGITSPRRNKVYIVRALRENGEQGFGILLEEIRNPIIKCKEGYMEPTFSEANFISATTLEDSKQWAEEKIRDLIMEISFEENEFSKPYLPLNYKADLIKSIMNKLDILHNLTDLKRIEFVNTFLDSYINHLKIMNESLEKELNIK